MTLQDFNHSSSLLPFPYGKLSIIQMNSIGLVFSERTHISNEKSYKFELLIWYLDIKYLHSVPLIKCRGSKVYI